MNVWNTFSRESEERKGAGGRASIRATEVIIPHSFTCDKKLWPLGVFSKGRQGEIGLPLPRKQLAWDLKWCPGQLPQWHNKPFKALPLPHTLKFSLFNESMVIVSPFLSLRISLLTGNGRANSLSNEVCFFYFSAPPLFMKEVTHSGVKFVRSSIFKLQSCRYTWSV